MDLEYPRPCLLDLVSNTLVLHQLAPYLPVTSRLALAATNRAFRQTLYEAPQTFRHVDLSFVTSAQLDTSAIDAGGQSWRAERMDESLTEDEFYSGPLRGIFHQLDKIGVLKFVQTLVLDGLSVPADLVQEIISSPRFNVRLLSIREARHLNARKLMQVLKYAVRPTRPDGTPRLRGLYYFTSRDKLPLTANNVGSVGGVMSEDGARIGAAWNEKSQQALHQALSHCEDDWYQPAGKLLSNTLSSEWAEVIRACEGVLAFDAVLCRGPRHDDAGITQGRVLDYSASDSWLPPSLATVALGPSGCTKCHSFEESPAVFGESPESHLPLLSPLPLHSSKVADAQRPLLTTSTTRYPPLFVRCENCLRGRWCERCHKSWCSDCYIGQEAGRHAEIGVARDCFGCGRTDCKATYIRTCVKCRSEYCIVDNEGSTQECCDWSVFFLVVDDRPRANRGQKLLNRHRTPPPMVPVEASVQTPSQSTARLAFQPLQTLQTLQSHMQHLHSHTHHHQHPSNTASTTAAAACADWTASPRLRSGQQVNACSTWGQEGIRRWWSSVLAS